MDLCMMTRPTLDERYRAAVHSGNMTSDPNTTRSDSDVVGAFGIADRHLTRGSDARGNHFPPAPLAVALARLFAGDNTAGHAIVETMAANLWRQARRQDVKMARVQSEDISRAVLALRRPRVRTGSWCPHVIRARVRGLRRDRQAPPRTRVPARASGAGALARGGDGARTRARRPGRYGGIGP
jgi:hypothetical protein